MRSTAVETMVGVVGCSAARRDEMGPEEVRFVHEQRRTVRASWQACADMVQRPVHDVRMKCDPEYRAAHRHEEPVRSRVVGCAPRAAQRHIVRKVGSPATRQPQPPARTSCGTRVLRAVAAGATTSKGVADLLGRDLYRATAILAQLAEAGRVERRLPPGKLKGYLYRLPERARRLAGEAARG